jgi:hypothetical protein
MQQNSVSELNSTLWTFSEYRNVLIIDSLIRNTSVLCCNHTSKNLQLVGIRDVINNVALSECSHHQEMVNAIGELDSMIKACALSFSPRDSAIIALSMCSLDTECVDTLDVAETSFILYVLSDRVYPDKAEISKVVNPSLHVHSFRPRSTQSVIEDVQELITL